MVIARSLAAGAARRRARGRHRRHAAEPVRPPGLGLPRDLADRCRSERRPPDRPGHQPALSELRRAACPPRVLAEPHDARVLRSVGSLQRRRSARRIGSRNASGGGRMHAADRYLLTRNVSRLFVQSRTIQAAAADVAGAASTVLYPPAPQRPYRCDGYGDYIFMVSRLTPLKRADLLIRALAVAEERGVRAVIGGEGEEHARLEALAAQLGVADRVTLTGSSRPRPNCSITSRAAVRCAFLRSTRTTGSSPPRLSPPARRSSRAVTAVGRPSSSSRRRQRPRLRADPGARSPTRSPA